MNFPRVRPWLRRAEEMAGARRTGWLLLLALGVIYTAAYFQHPLYPGNESDGAARGWWTWTDQQRYRNEAAAIAAGKLDAASFHYPVGYPLLGAALVRWLPEHPFFVPDLLLVLVAGALIWRLARRWLSALETFAVLLVFVVTHRSLLGITQVVPWNTIATQATLLAGIWVVFSRRETAAVGWLAGLGALTYAVRPIDAVAFAPLLLWATWRVTGWRRRIVAATGGAAVIAAVVLALAWLNVAIFGHWRSPYETVSAQTIGFFSYPLSYKFFWLFVDGGPLFGETEPGLLWRYPWLWLTIPGVVFAVRRERANGAVAMLAVALNAWLYLNYNDLLPSDIYRFTLIHYLTWWFPLIFILAMAACRHASGSRGVQAGFVFALGFVVICLGWRMEPEPVTVATPVAGTWRLPEGRPLLIEFPERPLGDVTQLRLDGRGLTEYSDYLTSYVRPELSLLIGTKTTGQWLAMEPAAPAEVPRISEFRWAWRLEPSRLPLLGK